MILINYYTICVLSFLIMKTASTSPISPIQQIEPRPSSRTDSPDPASDCSVSPVSPGLRDSPVSRQLSIPKVGGVSCFNRVYPQGLEMSRESSSKLLVFVIAFFFLLFVWSFRLFRSWLVSLWQYSSKFPSFLPPPPGIRCCRCDWPGLCLFFFFPPFFLSANRVD